MVDHSQIKSALAQVFGFHSFRPHQEGIVDAILSGRDAFAVMPTGGGKSLCYQLPAHLLPGVCVVVSPLISLMKDQVDAANANGLRAATLNSAVSDEKRLAAGRALREGKLDLLYVSPERFNTPGFAERLKALDLSFFAIDEAHCISEWGHDFRPDYLALSRIVEEFPGIPLAAFTATATPRVAEDIVARLGLREPHLTRASFNRPNLFYQVAPKEDLGRQLVGFLRERVGESGIIYRTTRKSVEETALLLNRNGFDAKPYHAGLPDETRAATQDAFRRDECQVIVATIAFGMGIDKPNVRFVIHGDLPKNLEGYYQETGRAGRDGEPARCALFFGRQDVAQLMRFAEGVADEQAKRVAHEQLKQMLAFAERDGCRRSALLAYFGETFSESDCGGCDICAGEVEREDATIPAQKALSAMVRTECRFGGAHLADILTGANTARIRELGHDRLPTYGVGKDKDKSYWRTLMDALLAQGLTRVDDPQYPVSIVTEEGWKVLRGSRKFEMLRQAATAKSRKRGRSLLAAGAEEPFSAGLFGELRQERLRLAQAEGVPPFVVFSDKTLRELARQFPDTPAEMLEVSGVGAHKLSAYGPAFLAVIRAYAEANPDEAAALRQTAKAASARFAGKGAGKGAGFNAGAGAGARAVGGAGARNYAGEKSAADDFVTPESLTELATLGFVEAKKSLAEISALRGLKPSTIVEHLEQLSRKGHEFPASQFIAPERLAWIGSLFQASGDWRLKPVVEAAEGKLDYVEARLARIFLNLQKEASAPDAGSEEG